MTTAHAWFSEYLALTGSGHSGTNWQCPAHPDGSPSLSVNEGDDGKVLLFCHAGCRVDEILQAIGLTHDVLFEARTRSPLKVFKGQISRPTYETFKYSTRRGKPLGSPVSVDHHVYLPDEVRLERCRYAGSRKTIRWEERRGRDWVYAKGLQLASLPLFREQEVLQGVAMEEVIILCESESSVDALMRAGLYATTWAGGSANPQMKHLTRVLSGAQVVLIPDNDPPGEKCRDAILAELGAHADIKVLTPPEADMDARDLLNAVGSRALRRQIDALWL